MLMLMGIIVKWGYTWGPKIWSLILWGLRDTWWRYTRRLRNSWTWKVSYHFYLGDQDKIQLCSSLFSYFHLCSTLPKKKKIFLWSTTTIFLSNKFSPNRYNWATKEMGKLCQLYLPFSLRLCTIHYLWCMI